MKTYKRYDVYKDSGVEWLGEIPAGWEVNKIKHVYALISDRALEKKNPVALENIESWTGKFVETDTEFEGNGILFQKLDILFGKLRPYLAKVHLAEMDGEGVGDFFVLRSKGIIYPEFGSCQLRTKRFIDVINGATFGAKMPRVGWDFMGNLLVTYPRLPEQAAIAAFLDEKTEKIDRAISQKERLIELLKERKQILIQEAVTKGLDPNVKRKDSGVEWIGEIPEHWEVKRNFSVFQEIKESGREGLPLLSVSIHNAVSDEELADDQNIRGKIKIEDKSNYKAVAPNDIVFNMMRAWQGAIGAVSISGMVSPAYIVARSIYPINSNYFEYLFRTPIFIEIMNMSSKGITDFRKRLYWDEFKNIQIVVPPLSEQKEIVAYIESHSGKIDRAIDLQNRQIEKLKEYRATLIDAAVTGKIRVA